ncbi:hypothetical protein FRC06_009045 [Ceratobasidium sp. 370]|nr:hypothetical protein FRC06_009045 [Ceratobasidium sp. 370]
MSRVKKYRNPHHHAFAESLMVVDRDVLRETPANPHSDPLTEDQQSDSEKLEALEQMLSSLRRDFARATGGQKRGHKLRILGPWPIVLSEPRLMLDWPSRRKILPVEDNEEEEIERSRRAKLAAIDAKTIVEQSSVSYAYDTALVQPAYGQTRSVEYELTGIGFAGPIAVLESRRQKPCSQPVDCSDDLQLASQDPKPKGTLLVRARPTKSTVRQPHSAAGAHSFYFPTDTMGGKSPGYGWGYVGSLPRRERSFGYIRDNIKKGLSRERYLELTEAATGCSSRGAGKKRKHDQAPYI